MNAFGDHFSGNADDYATYRPAYPVELVDFLTSLASDHDRAWDCGCGSGQLSVALGERFGLVIGTDASGAQIAAAHRAARIRYCVARAEAAPLADRSVDLAIAAQAAHWFDLARYYEEVRRVTRASGAVALVTYGRMLLDERLDALITQLHTVVLNGCWPRERRHVDRAYATLPFPFDEVAAPRLELEARWRLGELLGYIGTWSAVRALERAGGRERLERFATELATAWGPAETERPVRWPLTIRAARFAG
ncbi:MAG: class I SAM-dependent methyltransferase [Longimicrobiales bacterium]